MIKTSILFCRLKLLVETFEHFNFWTDQSKCGKLTNVLSQGIKQSGCKTLGTSVFNNPMSPPAIPGFRKTCLFSAYGRKIHGSLAGYRQGSKRIRHKMYIPYVNTQNYPFCRLQLVVEMFEHST